MCDKNSPVLDDLVNKAKTVNCKAKPKKSPEKGRYF